MSERYNCGSCAICSPAIFKREFPGAFRKARRSHDEVVLERRKKQEAIARRRELFAKIALEREAKRMARYGT